MYACTRCRRCCSHAPFLPLFPALLVLPWCCVLQARALVQQGQLFAAADAVTAAVQGTQAAAVVQEWVADARARAVADQAARLLQAHAAAVAAANA